MEDISSREKNLVTYKVTGALMFSVFGVMGFFFSLWKENWNSAVWCLLLEVSCVVLLVFSKSYLKGELHLKYSDSFFRMMKYTVVILTMCSFCAFLSYITIGIVKEEAFDVQSHYAASPVTLMTGFWSLILFFDTRKYEMLLE